MNLKENQQTTKNSKLLALKKLAWSGSKQFDTLMVILKEFFKKMNSKEKPADDKKQ